MKEKSSQCNLKSSGLIFNNNNAKFTKCKKIKKVQIINNQFKIIMKSIYPKVTKNVSLLQELLQMHRIYQNR